jgi:multidrug efflux pump subunit AcrA (membrane-fusion protein)
MSLHPALHRRPMLNYCLGLTLCAAALLLTGCEKQEAPKPPPAEVSTVTLTPQTVPVSDEFVAQVESSHQVEILARVSGFLDRILYKEGDDGEGRAGHVPDRPEAVPGPGGRCEGGG